MGAESLAQQHADTDVGADHQRGQQQDQRHRTAYRRQSLHAEDPADHNTVGQGIDLVQEVSDQRGDGKGQQAAQYVPLCHIK